MKVITFGRKTISPCAEPWSYWTARSWTCAPRRQALPAMSSEQPGGGIEGVRRFLELFGPGWSAPGRRSAPGLRAVTNHARYSDENGRAVQLQCC